jgi:hypothetical protein
LPYHGRHGDDLVVLGTRGVHHEVDDFDLIFPLEMCFADALQIDESGGGSWCLAGNIQPEPPLRLRRLVPEGTISTPDRGSAVLD